MKSDLLGLMAYIAISMATYELSTLVYLLVMVLVVCVDVRSHQAGLDAGYGIRRRCHA